MAPSPLYADVVSMHEFQEGEEKMEENGGHVPKSPRARREVDRRSDGEQWLRVR